MWAVIRGGWRVAAAAAGVIAACYGLGALVFGAQAYRDWADVIGAIAWYDLAGNGSFRGFFDRALHPTSGFAPLVDRPDLVAPLSWASFAVVGGMAMVAALRDRGPAATDRAFAQLLLASFLMSPLGWAYYTPWALLPIAAVYLGQGADPRSIPRSQAVLLGIAAVALFAPRWLEAYAFGDAKHPLLTLTVASGTFWAHLLAWIALLGGVPERLPERVRGGG